MELICLGSGSSGNCYLLTNETEALVIEAGLPFKSVKKALGYDITKIRGIIYSHEHGDHYKYFQEYKKAGIKTSESMKPNSTDSFGNFKVKAFELKHDVPNLGFLIKHPEIGLCAYITDTHYIPFRIKGVNSWIVEANYSEDILEENIAFGKTELIVRNRVIRSHLSLQTLKQALLENDLSQCNNIVLIHLSAQNSNAERFKKEISDITGKKVWVAKKGMKINFNKKPF